MAHSDAHTYVHTPDGWTPQIYKAIDPGCHQHRAIQTHTVMSHGDVVTVYVNMYTHTHTYTHIYIHACLLEKTHVEFENLL